MWCSGMGAVEHFIWHNRLHLLLHLWLLVPTRFHLVLLSPWVFGWPRGKPVWGDAPREE